ncbi:MAG: tetratricopeptide repeat protein [Candidatus Hodarchaeota archaeon]
MTNDGKKVPTICCLAKVMAKRFQVEMAHLVSIAKDNIPALRLAICSGRDIRVQLLDGRKDWVGDSARKAVRASILCYHNEILIDDSTHNWIQRDFKTKRVNIEKRILELEVKKADEEFPLSLYCLGELKKEAILESEAPGYFVYTLEVIGKQKEAHDLAEKVLNRLSDKAKRILADKEKEEQEILNSWNRLLNSISDYSFSVQILKKMKTEVRIKPDVKTYSIIIKKSPDSKTAKNWLETMRAEGIQLNVVTYSTLVAMSPDYDTAKNWLETMRAEGIQPNVVTYNTLIAMSPDYDTAKNWLETMRAEGIQPNVVTYSSLFSKDLSNKSADEILKWYLAQEYHPEVAIEAAITGYGKIGRIDQALRLALDYPHLPAALKLIHAYPDAAIQYFQNIFEDDPNHTNAAYALGVALFHLAKLEEAKLYLEKALKLATASGRKLMIKKLLQQIGDKRADN